MTTGSDIHHAKHINFAARIFIGMIAGILVGSLLRIGLFPHVAGAEQYILDGILKAGADIFITLMKMMVVPIVFVSIVCGVCSLGDPTKLGRLGLKTLLLYLLTTAIAITLGLTVANLLNVGGSHEMRTDAVFAASNIPSVKDTLLNIFPSNPVKAIADGNMLQIIVFSLMIGAGIALTGEKGKPVAQFFQSFNAVLMRLIMLLVNIAPYGVFCLLAALFAKQGFGMILTLLAYFCTVLLVLCIHVIFTNSLLLRFIANLNPWIFFKKMYPAMLFAFSTTSSNVSIPITLSTVEKKLGVNNSVASFIVPLGATVNMDGTAIMQGVATVFIAHTYGVSISLSGYILVVLTATLASIGTAGIPGGSGLIMLTMVLQQVGLPVGGIALVLGVDRFLEMVRTAVNITGDSAISCVVGKTEKELDEGIYLDPNAAEEETVDEITNSQKERGID